MTFNSIYFTLFDDNQLNHVDFKLKKLSITTESIQNKIAAENFQKFASNHKDTLEKLYVQDCENIIDFFAKFSTLKYVNFG